MSNVPKLTRRQAAIIGAYTGYTCGPYGDIVDYVGTLPTFRGISDIGMSTHFKAIQQAAKADFLALCADVEDNNHD